MKEFIYLDTDYLTSALAQIHKGNINSLILESADEDHSETGSSSEKKTSANVGFKSLFSLGNVDSEGNESSVLSIKSAKEMMTKSFDDYAYNILYKYIEDNKLVKKANYTVNDFALKNGNYDLIDFNFITTLLSDDFIDLYVKSGKNKDKSFFKEMKDNIEMFKKVVPSDTILVMDNIVAPIKKEFLRGDYKDISFKYDNINLLARITKVHKPINTVGPKMILHAVSYMLPTIMDPYQIKIQNGTLIATPIAIYIE